MLWFKQAITGRDNETVDAGRVSWVVSVLAIITGTVANWWHTGLVDVQTLWQALAGTSLGHGVAIGAKAKTEPDKPTVDNPDA